VFVLHGTGSDITLDDFGIFPPTQRKATFTDLVNGVRYTLVVIAENRWAWSPAAQSSTTVGAPMAPTGVVAFPGVAKVTVSWTAPASNGSPITTYVVTPYIAAVAQTPLTFPATATTRTVTGLTRGVTYAFKIAAVNARGAGPLSAKSNYVAVK
jgi:hypothetical protein